MSIKTLKALTNVTTYKSGRPAYRGNVKSYYAGTLHSTVEMKPVLSNAGIIVCTPESEILSACKKLQKGQIGALKECATEVQGGTTITAEYVAEVYDATEAIDGVSNPPSIEAIVSKFEYTTNNGEKISYAKAREIMEGYAESNQRIRNEIETLKAAYNWKKGSKMPEQLLLSIKEKMVNYSSFTGFDIEIVVRHQHVISTTDDYVVCTDQAALENARLVLNYNQIGNRLIGSKMPYRRFIPIQTVEQLKEVKNFLWMKHYRLKSKNVMWVCSERFNPDGVDLIAAAARDRELSI